MNHPAAARLIAALHQDFRATVLAVTGGGSSVIGNLLRVPGASRTLLEAVVPYASSALADWLGTAADQACSEPTARAMAMAAWIRARKLSADIDPSLLIGVGATASLVSDRPKKGEHRIHVVTQTTRQTRSFSLVLEKDRRHRPAEETVASMLVLIGLAEAAGIDALELRHVLTDRLDDGEAIEEVCLNAHQDWAELLLGERSYVGCGIDDKPRAIFPGAFNPPHAAHHEIARIAGSKLGYPVAYELSITNVDKPPLDFIEIDQRLNALRGEAASEAVVLTDAPTFRRKSELFPGCTFVVGADTIARVGDPKYYSGAEGSFDAAIAQIADRGCRFLVFGRKIDGRFRVLSDLTLPPALRALCEEITEEEFREDVSSTEVRKSNKG